MSAHGKKTPTGILPLVTKAKKFKANPVITHGDLADGLDASAHTPRTARSPRAAKPPERLRYMMDRLYFNTFSQLAPHETTKSRTRRKRMNPKQLRAQEKKRYESRMELFDDFQQYDRAMKRCFDLQAKCSRVLHEIKECSVSPDRQKYRSLRQLLEPLPTNALWCNERGVNIKVSCFITGAVSKLVAMRMSTHEHAAIFVYNNDEAEALCKQVVLFEEDETRNMPMDISGISIAAALSKQRQQSVLDREDIVAIDDIDFDSDFDIQDLIIVLHRKMTLKMVFQSMSKVTSSCVILGDTKRQLQSVFSTLTIC